MTESQFDVLIHFVALTLLGGIGLIYIWELGALVGRNSQKR